MIQGDHDLPLVLVLGNSPEPGTSVRLSRVVSILSKLLDSLRENYSIIIAFVQFLQNEPFRPTTSNFLLSFSM